MVMVMVITVGQLSTSSTRGYVVVSVNIHKNWLIEILEEYIIKVAMVIVMRIHNKGSIKN